MRYLLCLAVLALAVPSWAAEETIPNPLTAKEAADGWLSLFDGETTFGWNIEGQAKVDKGMLILGGTEPTMAACTSQFTYGGFRFEALTDDAKDANLTFNAYKARPFIHVAPPQEKGWHGFGAQVMPDDISIWASGSKGFGIRGKFDERTAVAFHLPAGQKLVLRNIKFWPHRLTPIFNGMDLTGWKKLRTDDKRAKTEFSVTSDGLLHLKNGPGDLQTEGQYDDFVLQVECKTNGNRLNSGVFFRCIPGEYQNGYEAQIDNGFDPDKPKEYTVEEYDPKTNELKEKKKVKATALDYGTGAIYRRIPARKQAAKDNEWFTMTVAAQGRHIATWVNGIQVVDWTDNRPLKDNARNGCRLEKGPISLQGHDPTTDIDFRNIRIGELPRPAEKK